MSICGSDRSICLVVDQMIDVLIVIRANNITDGEELKKLAVLPMLRALVLFGNEKRRFDSTSERVPFRLETPLSEKDSYRMDVLVAVEKLER